MSASSGGLDSKLYLVFAANGPIRSSRGQLQQYNPSSPDSEIPTKTILGTDIKLDGDLKCSFKPVTERDAT